MIPSGTDFTIAVARPRQAGEPWKDAEGRWWTPGKRGLGGAIVSDTPGQFIQCGLVVIRDEDAQELSQYGWKIAPIAATDLPAGLIHVQR